MTEYHGLDIQKDKRIGVANSLKNIKLISKHAGIVNLVENVKLNENANSFKNVKLVEKVQIF